MTLPRPVVPGRTYLITRRCSERRFLLRPGKQTDQAFLYCLAEAAQRFDIEVAAVLAMSNHYHAVVHDPRGSYPDFIEHFHKLAAKVLNAHWGRWEALWASEQTSVVHLIEPTDAFDKMIYTLTNPVADHLVERATDWPGVSSLVAQLNGTTMTARRPPWFFDKEGGMPEQVELVLRRVPGFESMSQEKWASKIRAAVAKVEQDAAAERAASSTRVLGRKAVLRQSAFHAPATHAPRRELRPRIAARNKWRRIEALRRAADFQRAYRAALLARRTGRRAVTFPPGTYKLARLGLVSCAPPPAVAAARRSQANGASPPS